MNTKKYLLLSIATVCMVLFSATDAMAWGKLGHATTIEIANRHLTEEARKNISKYLNADSLVNYAVWLDEVRRTPEYQHTNGWHSSQVSKSGKFSLWSEKKYRVYDGLGGEYEKLKNYEELTDSAVVTGLKIVCHLVGDMHCPSHTFFKGTSQNFSFVIGGKKMMYHKFWDSGLLSMTRDISPTEYAEMLDTYSAKKIASIQKGKATDWIEGNARSVRKTYSWLERDAKYDEMESNIRKGLATELCDTQIRKAGYRLAHVLNILFDKEYAARFEQKPIFDN